MNSLKIQNRYNNRLFPESNKKTRNVNTLRRNDCKLHWNDLQYIPLLQNSLQRTVVQTAKQGLIMQLVCDQATTPHNTLQQKRGF